MKHKPSRNLEKMNIRKVVLELAWQRLLIAAAAKGCTLEASTDHWEGESYGWQLNFPDGSDVFWVDVYAEPGLQKQLPMPEFDERAAQGICDYLELTEDMLEDAQ
jgi:hypothetical protein